MGHLRTSLEHLPEPRQQELARAVEILHEEFMLAIKGGTSNRKKTGRIQKIILFGSFAKGTWVNDLKSGYKSDFDLLIIVNQNWLVTFYDCWNKVEDRLMNDPIIRREVNFIVHTLSDVNDNLAKGQYFFTDIKHEGIALHDLKGSRRLCDQKNLSPAEAYDISKKYYDLWFPKIGEAVDGVHFYKDKQNKNMAAFLLHQAVEAAYHCVLLTFTHYVPATHNIKFLRSLAEQQDARLAPAWPRDKSLPDFKQHKTAYELLTEAYVKARYSEFFNITDAQLSWLTEQTTVLEALVKEACETRLADIKATL